jgi:hypothetical protein
MGIKVISKNIRMSKEDLEVLREGARKYGMTDSGWVRHLTRIGLLLVRPTIYKEPVKNDMKWE